MRHKRSWEEMNCPQRPLIFEGWADLDKRPSTFKWEPMDFPPGLREIGTARIYYRVGWTALLLWDGAIYFADELFLFDEMIELLRSRMFARFLLQTTWKRDLQYD